MNNVSEYLVSEDLKNFLEMNLPKIKKKKSFQLGVIEPQLASTIQEELGAPCRSDDSIREIIRGLRVHFSSFVKELAGGMLEKAQLGLGHSYSRAKVKFNPGRADNMIIQSICLLDQLDKDLNTFAMRVREWYCWHFPELRELVKDNYLFARCAAFIQDRTSLTEDKLPELTEIVMDEDLAKQIVHASKLSMGMECSPVDMLNISQFTSRMVALAEYRKQLFQYLQEKMATVAPNLATLIGETVAARLISKAGSLTSLAKCPASTVQILGAEKALFRALKTKGNTPKYGLIYHSTFIGRAAAKNKGRISRYLANKCAIASRIDSFIEEPTTLYGEKLRDQVEERLNFYDTGEAPRKNIDVMELVAKSIKEKMAEAKGDEDGEGKKKKKKKKKDKTPKKSDADEDEEIQAETPKTEKKKKKKKRALEEEAAITPEPSAKKKKKDKSSKKKKKKSLGGGDA
uniref:Nucleolar protein 56 n=4 Tax=Heterosigma akashiwo TaxID=2829 RepID=A0A6V1P0N8_HETAK